MNKTKITPWFIFLCLYRSRLQKRKRVASSPSTEQLQEGGGIFGFKPKTLFVFGDSYADTGNTPVTIAALWRFPYGITFPGKPAGQFSNDRLSTDYLAKYLGFRTPVPYKLRRYARPRQVEKKGINFAYGGAGVFETMFKVPNTSMHINFFEQLLWKKVYSSADLNSSVAFFSLVSNDYLTYDKFNGIQQVFDPFPTRVVRMD
ncbi:unnamed protein product [Arabis nemorensis]|uniref:GDSL esterase/lipase n=1 Tax=Arabis nemorensis TaxID=586526 RepID=A0A565BLW2_9BRAS|nr:unnamed protein product [Arabis nemorensis]